MGALTDEETMELRLLKKTTSMYHDPWFCAEPEIFLRMRKKCKEKPSQTQHLSVFAMSAEIVGSQIRVKITSSFPAGAVITNVNRIHTDDCEVSC